MIVKAPLSKDLLEKLYSSGASMADIAKQLKCSIHKVAYWMIVHGIKRRSMSEAIYIQQNPNGHPFHIKTILTQEESFLYGLGLGIYWGEGEKISKGRVRVANTDPNLLLTFRQFLITICQVTFSRIHYYLICFNDSNTKEVGEHWAKILNISEDKFGKIVQIPPQGKGTYRKKSRFGVCILEISNTKLKQWIMEELYKCNYMPR